MSANETLPAVSFQGPLADLKPLDKVDEVNRKLTALRGYPCHLLTSVVKIDSIPALHVISFNAIAFSGNPADREVYRKSNWAAGYYGLTHIPLMRLLSAAGGSIIHSSCQKRDQNYVEWKCIGELREVSGSVITQPAATALDLRDGSPEIVGMTPAQLLEERKWIYQKAESKAMNRVIRKILGLQQSYPQEAFEVPFVTAKPVPDLDPTKTDDPVIKQAILAHILGHGALLFGESGQFNLQKALTSRIELDEEEMVAAAQIEAPPPPGVPPAAPLTPKLTVEQFQTLDAASQVDHLKKMMRDKEWTKPFSFPLEQFKEAHRLQFFQKLLPMPDVESSDKLPF